MLTTEKYILSPLPIEKELGLLFQQDQSLTIFDIGACEGEDAIKYSRLFPKSTVFAFEPRPDNLEKIDRHLRQFDHGDIRVSSVALSNEKGKAVFYLSSGSPDPESGLGDWDFGNKSSSLLPPSEAMKEHTSWLQFENKIEVQTERLDAFCDERNIRAIDFVHIDVQGAELMVFEGAGELLKNIGVIWTEVERIELYQNQPLENDVRRFLEDHNFVCVKSTVDAVAGDQLYINRTLFSADQIDSLKKLITKQQRIKRLKTIYYSIRNKFIPSKT
jgi:FkbM family methyltransferase